MVFDLDSAGDSRDDFEAVREAARLLGELLGELKPPSVLMTTGSRGLHVVVPVNGRQDFDEVRALDDPGLDARRWTIADAVERARTNPWGCPPEGLANGGAATRRKRWL
ncbi:hypothetical protein M2271_002391 [Streptomyces sp. LBL]|nr:hypothetical protein [Streptomyces sp. LBL]